MDNDTVGRFWSKIKFAGVDECWEWQEGLSDSGYGRFWVNAARRTEHANRIAWEIVNRSVPAGKCVCHTCDNRRCCNPNHLWLGTKADNLRDMREKGRAAKGETNARAVMTKERVIRLRERLAEGKSYDALAVEFGISKATVAQIATGRTWKHAEGPVRPARTLRPRLSPEQRQALRADRAAGMSYPNLGRKYGVNTSTAHNICKAGHDEGLRAMS